MKQNVSVIISVLNEEESIAPLLEHLKKQTLQPTEVVIVDAGSTDQTCQVILQFIVTSAFPIRIISYPDSNRSQARNRAIENATSQIIAVTDAGCFPQNDWLEKLTTPFEDPKTDVVAGFYDPHVANGFENVIANVTSTRSWEFDAATYLPSSRSIAFTKKIWKEVGGYREDLDFCEDLIFAEHLQRASKGWVVEKEAVVLWPQPKNLTQLQEKIFHYATGDLQAQYERHTRKIHSAVWRIIILLGFALPLLSSQNLTVRSLGFFLGLLYISGSVWKHRKVITSPLSCIYIPVVQLVVDIALIQALIYYRLQIK